jgi:hypothetical protein
VEHVPQDARAFGRSIAFWEAADVSGPQNEKELSDGRNEEGKRSTFDWKSNQRD